MSKPVMADRRHRGVTDHHGHARIAYRISDATVRYRVVVDVHVTKAGHSANCHTSFTPVRS